MPKREAKSSPQTILRGVPVRFWCSFVKYSGLIGTAHCLKSLDSGFPFIREWCDWNGHHTLSDGQMKKCNIYIYIYICIYTRCCSDYPGLGSSIGLFHPCSSAGNALIFDVVEDTCPKSHFERLFHRSACACVPEYILLPGSPGIEIKAGRSSAYGRTRYRRLKDLAFPRGGERCEGYTLGWVIDRYSTPIARWVTSSHRVVEFLRLPSRWRAACMRSNADHT